MNASAFIRRSRTILSQVFVCQIWGMRGSDDQIWFVSPRKNDLGLFGKDENGIGQS